MSDTPFARSPSNRVAAVFFAMGAVTGGGTVTVLHDATTQMAAADASYQSEHVLPPPPVAAPVVIAPVIAPLVKADASYTVEVPAPRHR